MSSVGAVVLAAGRSSRYRAAGGAEATKLVAEMEGKPIVRRAVEAALASRARPVVVVAGHARDAVEAALAGLPVALAFNPDFATGIASSLRIGSARAPGRRRRRARPAGRHAEGRRRVDRPADRRVRRRRPRPGRSRRSQDGRRGNPVLLARPLFEAAMRLEGDEGARRLLSSLGPNRIVEVETTGGDASFDVDTPEDLAAAALSVGRGRV